MEMSMNVLAMFVANALKLKDDEEKHNLLIKYEEAFPQEKGVWWEKNTYKHVITTIMARVNTPFFSKNSLSAMATDIPLLLGILFSINPNFDNKNKIEDWDNNKERYKENEDTPDGKKIEKELRGSIRECINSEFENLKICFDKVNIEDLNKVFYTYYSSENKNNTNFTYNNVKEVIALFTNYFNLVNYLFRNSDNKTNFMYPFICPDLDEDMKTIVLFETDNLDNLRENFNEFIKHCRNYYYPLIASKNEE